MEHRHKRLKTRGEDSEVDTTNPDEQQHPSLPIFSLGTAETTLNDDVNKVVFDYFDNDPASFCKATWVCRAFKSALLPRQKNVWYGGFKSFESFRQMNFVGMEVFSGRGADNVTNDVLQALAEDVARYRHLKELDLIGCKNIDSSGVWQIMQAMGPRLETLKISLLRSPFGNDGQEPVGWMSEILSRAHRLLSLTVQLHGAEPLGFLRPVTLSSLETLRIKPLDGSKTSISAGFLTIRSPSQKTLEITDLFDCIVENELTLSAQALINVMSISGNFETLILNAVGPESMLYRGIPAEQEELLFHYLDTHNITYIGPTHVTKRCGANFSVVNGAFVNHGDWTGR